jgi:hypothetical protein
MPSERVSERAFLAVSVLLFAANAAETIIIWSASMSAMSGMPMPGGWTMSMAWMRMAGQTWSAAAASFLGMWVVRMVSMMLPPVVPMLRRYRQSVDGRGEMRLGRLTAFVGVGYCVEGIPPCLRSPCRHRGSVIRCRPTPALGRTCMAGSLMRSTSVRLLPGGDSWGADAADEVVRVVGNGLPCDRITAERD